MTISSETARNDYTGNGSTPDYDYNFRILDKTHIKVIEIDLDDVETELVLDTDYTVAGVGSYSGGTITLSAGNLTNGHKLVILRQLPMLQETDLRNQGGYYPETVEDSLDLLTMISQQFDEELGRCVKQAEGEAGSDLEFPLLADRAGLFLGFDAQGDPIAAVASGAPASAFMATVLDDTSAAAARTTLGAASTEGNVYTGTETWHVGTDVASSGSITLPTGNLFDITGTTTITGIATKGVGTVVILQFDAILTLTHHATDLILPGAADITTAAGDVGIFYEYATGDWRCAAYTKADGKALFGSASADTSSVVPYAMDILAQQPGMHHFKEFELSFVGLTTPRALKCSHDDQYLFHIDSTNTIYRYKFGTPRDITTLYIDQSWSTSTQTNDARDFQFNDDGTKMYLFGLTGTHFIWRFSLSTAYDLSTLSIDTGFDLDFNADLSISLTTYQGFAIADNGNKLYLMYEGSGSADYLREHDLGTAWDVSTAGPQLRQYQTGGQESTPRSVIISSDGRKFWHCGTNKSRVMTWLIGGTNPYELTSVTLDEGDWVAPNSSGQMTGCCYNGDGTVLFTIDDNHNVINQFDLVNPYVPGHSKSWGGIFERKGMAKATSSSFHGLAVGSSGLDIFVVTSNDFVYQFKMTAPWDLSTLTLHDDLYLGSVAVFNDIALSPDGIYFPLLNNQSKQVIYYRMNTAWDLTTYGGSSGAVSYSTEIGLSTGYVLSVAHTGKHHYVLGSNQIIYQYDLTTAWDGTTGSYSGNSLNVSANVSTSPRWFRWRPDGKMFWIGGSAGIGAICEYQLTTAWAISTASHVRDFDAGRPWNGAGEGGDFFNEGKYLACTENSDLIIRPCNVTAG